MRVGKIPVASIVLLLIFGAKFIINVFFPEKSATFEPMFTGILEIAIVVFVIYYLTLFVKWAYNYRKAA
jgi:amino acid transporter